MNTASEVKAAFAAAGVKVRVRNFPRSFRVCTLDGSAIASFQFVAVNAGLKGYVNQSHEMFIHKKG